MAEVEDSLLLLAEVEKLYPDKAEEMKRRGITRIRRSLLDTSVTYKVVEPPKRQATQRKRPFIKRGPCGTKRR